MTTPITTAQINDNDAFRKAFTSISTKALPYMAPDAYFSDLLYDAAQAARLAEDGRFYLLVRYLGTNAFAYGDDAIEHCNPDLSDGRAVLRVKRTRFDTFKVDVIHERATRPAERSET